MLTKEQKTVLSVIFGITGSVLSVCLYGFAVGGEYLCFKYLLYCVVTAFVMTSLAFLFIFGKKTPKKLFWKELYIVIILVVSALQLLMYQPLNLLTSEDKGKEYEVEITEFYSTRGSTAVYFTDENGIPRKKDITLNFMIMDSGELYPQTGGRMIVKETNGGFNCKHFEIVKVTYEPEVFY
ncbi:MAG: hypothetical protein IJB74_09945 [Clostridia bacterium]|nr:hypothetical protein [Clostridia bacterium]